MLSLKGAYGLYLMQNRLVLLQKAAAIFHCHKIMKLCLLASIILSIFHVLFRIICIQFLRCTRFVGVHQSNHN